MLNSILTVLKSVLLFLLIPLALCVLYTWITLHWVYSSGERAGYVQKLSQKGFVCKTYEGELILVSMPGTQAEKFFFTVKDARVADLINQSVGKRVRLKYEQHVGVPTSCFGETQYFVNQVKIVSDKMVDEEMFSK